VKIHRCERCGTPAKSATARCSACGVTPVIIASGFGNAPDTWEVTPPIDKTRVVVLDDNELRAGMPPRSEVPGWVMGCAWTRGDYIDVDVTAPIAFGGLWLWLYTRELAGRALLPVNDPSLAAALEAPSHG